MENNKGKMGVKEVSCHEISDQAVLVKNPVVSVRMSAYNHEPYIAQAIEGVVMQETEYPFELIIGEDCSTDRTREIVLDYQKKHPNIIRVLAWDENVGGFKNGMKAIEACRGKYMAICEGDDFWTDTNKLQLQVDILEEHPEFSGTSHNVNYLNDPDNEADMDREFYGEMRDSRYTLKNVTNGNCVAGALCSFVFRNFYTKELLDKMKSPGFPRMNHIGISTWLALQGDVYYFGNVMATHRYIMKKGSTNWKSKSLSTNHLGFLYDLFPRLEKAAFEEFGVKIDLHKSKYAHFYQMVKKAFTSFKKSDFEILMDTWKKSGNRSRYFFLTLYSAAYDVARSIWKKIKSLCGKGK